VISDVDFLNGLTVVSCFLKALSAIRLVVRPNKKGIIPKRFQLKVMTLETGNRKCKATITTRDRNI
jgi:hypothetical protein